MTPGVGCDQSQSGPGDSDDDRSVVGGGGGPDQFVWTESWENDTTTHNTTSASLDSNHGFEVRGGQGGSGPW